MDYQNHPIHPADSVTPESICRLLKTHWAGQSVEYHSVIDSTNFRAKKLGFENAPHGTLVIADLQTAGRGRMQRSWESKPGDSILMSLLLRPEKLPPMQATGIVLIAAIAAAMACRDEGADVSIKWPNDLISNGKKISGMLLDMALSGEFVDFVIAGIGINIKSFPYAEDLKHASCLNDACGHEVSRAKLVAGFLTHFERLYELWINDGINAILPVYRDYSITLGRRVRVIGLNESFEAQALDVLADGSLLVRLDNGRETAVHAGDVSVRGVMDYI